DAEEDAETIGNGSDGLQVLVEALAFDEFHGVEDAAVLEGANVVDGNHAGMLEQGENAGFAQEPSGEIGAGAGQVQHFQSNATLQLFVFRGVDHTHAAAGDLGLQAIASAGKIGKFGRGAKPGQRPVGEPAHQASQPKAALASR